MAEDENPPNATFVHCTPYEHAHPTGRKLTMTTVSTYDECSALIHDIRETFQEFGEILDVVAKKNLKAKGQAFVVFDSADSAELAKDTLEGFELHGREISVSYAKTRSDATVKREDGEQEYAEFKNKRLAEKERKQAAEAAARKPTKREAAGDAVPERPAKSTKPALNPASGVPDEFLPPNKTLVLRDLPDGFDKDRLTEMFSPYAGFKEVRMVPRMKIAFAEYKDIESAVPAKEATNGTVVEGSMIRVTYQKQ